MGLTHVSDPKCRLDVRGYTDGFLAAPPGRWRGAGTSPPRVDPDERLDGTALSPFPNHQPNTRRDQKGPLGECER